jgi:hypothetical protein
MRFASITTSISGFLTFLPSSVSSTSFQHLHTHTSLSAGQIDDNINYYSISYFLFCPSASNMASSSSPSHIVPFFPDDTIMPNEIVDHVVQTVQITANDVFEFLEHYPSTLIHYLRQNPHVARRLHDRLSFDGKILDNNDEERAVDNRGPLQVDGPFDTVGRANSHPLERDLPDVNTWYRTRMGDDVDGSDDDDSVPASPLPSEPDRASVVSIDNGRIGMGVIKEDPEADPGSEFGPEDHPPQPVISNALVAQTTKVNAPGTNPKANPAQLMASPTIPVDPVMNKKMSVAPRDWPAHAVAYLNASHPNFDPNFNPQEQPFLPYPAPADLVVASQTLPARREWRLFEEESCIKHMIDVLDEELAGATIKGEARFTEAARRMAVLDNVDRQSTYGLKNQWNRKLRARSGRDERKKKSIIVSTSHQRRQGNSNSSSDKRSQRRTKPTKEDEEVEMDYEALDDEPTLILGKRKQHDDEKDDDYEPAVDKTSKTLKTPRMKKARHSATV